MTLKKYIIFSIGSLILLSSLLIIFSASKFFKSSEITFALQTLLSNNKLRNKTIVQHLNEFKNISESYAFNYIMKYKEPIIPSQAQFLIIDEDNKLIKDNKLITQNNCKINSSKNFDKKLNYFLTITDNKACLYIPFIIKDKTYLSIVYSDLNFIKQKNINLDISEILVLPNRKFLNLNNTNKIDKQILNLGSGFIEDDNFYYQKSKVEKTNVTLVSFIAKNKLGTQFYRFYYYSFFNLFIIILVSIFIFYFILNSITDPINQIVISSKKISMGNYNISFKKTKYKEINQLIDSFDLMVKKVKVREEAMNKEIENKTKELIRTSKMAALGSLAGGVAHEFNNILGAIIGHTSLALENKNPKEMEEALAISLTASEKACSIIDRLLDFSKTREYKKSIFKLSEAINNIAQLLKNDFLNNNIDIIFNDEFDDYIEAEQTQIEQVFLNMVINSRHSIKEKHGTIKIYFEKDKNYIYAYIKDNGSGIDANLIDKIFEPFFTTKGVYGQGKEFGSKDAEGTGLGLSVSLGIIENHKGTIEVLETSKIGTTFKLSLPLYYKGEI